MPAAASGAVTDPSFGDKGFATIDLNAEFNDVDTYPDGKIIASGPVYSDDGDQTGGVVARFKSDGSLDSTFGDGGLLQTPATGVRVRGAGALIIRDDEVVAVDSKGDVDPSFGDNGRYTAPDPEGGGTTVEQIDVAGDGSVFIGAISRSEGSGSSIRGILIKLTPAGVPDSSFGEQGVRVLFNPNASLPGLYQLDDILATANGGAVVSFRGQSSFRAQVGSLRSFDNEGQLISSAYLGATFAHGADEIGDTAYLAREANYGECLGLSIAPAYDFGDEPVPASGDAEPYFCYAGDAAAFGTGVVLGGSALGSDGAGGEVAAMLLRRYNGSGQQVAQALFGPPGEPGIFYLPELASGSGFIAGAGGTDLGQRHQAWVAKINPAFDSTPQAGIEVTSPDEDAAVSSLPAVSFNTTGDVQKTTCAVYRRNVTRPGPGVECTSAGTPPSADGPDDTYCYLVRATTTSGAVYNDQRCVILDQTPPDTRAQLIPHGPYYKPRVKVLLDDPVATARFDEAPSSFFCRLDQQQFHPCGSTVSYSGLTAGRHRFAAYAIDAAGNRQPTPTVRHLVVKRANDPGLKVSNLSSPATLAAFERSGITARFRCQVGCFVKLEVSVPHKVKRQAGLPSRTIAGARTTFIRADTPAALRAKPSAATVRRLHRAGIGRVTYRVQVSGRIWGRGHLRSSASERRTLRLR